MDVDLTLNPTGVRVFLEGGDALDLSEVDGCLRIRSIEGTLAVLPNLANQVTVRVEP